MARFDRSWQALSLVLLSLESGGQRQYIGIAAASAQRLGHQWQRKAKRVCMSRLGLIAYDTPLWRPPSEARSLIIQATYGCSHNKCLFCHMYTTKRFRARPEQELTEELEAIAEHLGTQVERIFLADGDPMVLPAERMVRLLQECYRLFPRLKRVTTYATPQNLLRKTPEELVAIRSAGLTMLYYGVESGDDETLEAVSKGANSDAVVEAARKGQQAGFDLSVTVLLGLAGGQRSMVHARRTAEVLSRIDPRYASALTIMDPDPEDLVELGGEKRKGKGLWGRMSVWELLAELRELLSAMEMTDCVFRSNHASNYLALKGTLPKDKERLIQLVDEVLERRELDELRPESYRGL